jgi:hypothetical protein
MLYVSESQDEVREHEKYHDIVVNGLSTPPLTSDCVVWSHDNERITVISQSSPSEQRDLAEEVAKFARKNARYGAEVLFGEMEVRVFLLHKEDRVVGLLLMDKRDHVYKASWDELAGGKQAKEMQNHPPIWAVCLVWVLEQYRRHHFAKTMLNQAMIYLGCSLDDIGWYTPFTNLGKAFVRSCCPNEFYIAK